MNQFDTIFTRRILHAHILVFFLLLYSFVFRIQINSLTFLKARLSLRKEVFKENGEDRKRSVRVCHEVILKNYTKERVKKKDY